MFLTFVLTVATLAVQSLLKAGCSVHTWLAAWNHDLVGVGFCAGEGSRAGRDYRLSRDTSPSPVFRLIRTMWGCRLASACCLLLLPSAVSTKRKRVRESGKSRTFNDSQLRGEDQPVGCSGLSSSTCSRTGPHWLETSMATEGEEAITLHQ